MVLRQLLAAIARSAAVISTCTNFSASTNAEGVTSGPTAGPAPNAGGAPGGRSVDCCAKPRCAVAAANRLRDVWVRNCRRDFDMNPPTGIVDTEPPPICHTTTSHHNKSAPTFRSGRFAEPNQLRSRTDSTKTDCKRRDDIAPRAPSQKFPADADRGP